MALQTQFISQLFFTVPSHVQASSQKIKYFMLSKTILHFIFFLLLSLPQQHSQIHDKTSRVNSDCDGMACGSDNRWNSADLE